MHEPHNKAFTASRKKPRPLKSGVNLQNTTTMNFGTIKFWNDEKGYGFISPDNGGKDVFVHIKSFKKCSDRPEIGQVVSYDTSMGEWWSGVAIKCPA